MVAHRWSDDRQFANPSVFCADQLLLIAPNARVARARSRYSSDERRPPWLTLRTPVTARRLNRFAISTFRCRTSAA